MPTRPVLVLLLSLLLPLVAAPTAAEASCRYFHCVCGFEDAWTWRPPDTLVEGSVLQVGDDKAYVVVEAVHAAPADGAEVGHVLTAPARNGAIQEGDRVLLHGGRAYRVADDDLMTCAEDPLPVTREEAVAALLGSSCQADLEALYPDADMTPPCNDAGGCSSAATGGESGGGALGLGVILLTGLLLVRRRRS